MSKVLKLHLAAARRSIKQNMDHTRIQILKQPLVLREHRKRGPYSRPFFIMLGKYPEFQRKGSRKKKYLQQLEKMMLPSLLSFKVKIFDYNDYMVDENIETDFIIPAAQRVPWVPDSLYKIIESLV